MVRAWGRKWGWRVWRLRGTWGLIWGAAEGEGARQAILARREGEELARIRELGAPQEVRVGLVDRSARRVVSARQVAGEGEVVVVRRKGLLR